MPRIGENINWGLGKTDYSNYLRGAQQGAAAMGQGIAAAGKGVGDYLKKQGEAKKEVAGTAKLMESFASLHEGTQIGQVAGQYAAQLKDEELPMSQRHGAAQKGSQMLQMLSQKQGQDIENEFKERRMFLDEQATRHGMQQDEAAGARADGHLDINRQNADTNQAEMLNAQAEKTAAYSSSQFLADFTAQGSPMDKAGVLLEAHAPEDPAALDAYKGMVSQGLEQKMAMEQEAQAKAAEAGLTLDPAERKRREEMGKFVAGWESGGRQTAETNMTELDDVIDKLETGAVNSGFFSRMGGKLGNAALYDTEQRIQRIVFQSLKATLGAQFTEKEAERLMNTAFDKAMDEERNTKKLKVLRDDLKQRIKSAEKQSAEVRNGFTGQPAEAPQAERLSRQDLIRALRANPAQKKSSDGVRGDAGPPGARNNVPDQPVGGTLTSFVKAFEGWNPDAYDDYGQVSIGYGTRAKGGEKSISKAEAEKRLAAELSKHTSRVEQMNKAHGYNWTQEQKDALTSFDYNTGRLEQLTANGKRDNAKIAEMMPQYRKAGGKVLRGLERRRKAERALFLNGYAG